MKDIKTKIITIETPHHFGLQGVFLKEKRVKNIFIYIHGLGGNLFRHLSFLESLVDRETAVLTFNNRGSGIINKVRKLSIKGHSRQNSIIAGKAHETFSDCLDDIEGAVNWAKAVGGRNIYLIGHSTGCQKSIYYLSRKLNPAVKGAILLAPMSDYADTYAFTDKKVYRRALAYAKGMVKNGKGHELMSGKIWPKTIDAQRWLSLFTPESEEEIFSYASGKRPSTLLKNKKPILVILAEEDEFKDRPVKEIADWFSSVLKGRDAQVRIVKKATHSFSDSIGSVKKLIKKWVS